MPDWRRLAGAVCFALVLGGAANVPAAERTDTGSPTPAPRGTYRVDGVDLFIHCTGSGEPTVVLDAGLANDHGYWRQIEAAAGATTRVCSWDRPGWGRSGRRPGKVLTATAVVRGLRGLLVAAGLSGPYILAGHSIGGLDMQAFARRYPASVAGMVLVDSTSPMAFPRYAAAFAVNGFTFDVGAEARLLRRHPLRVRWPLVVLEHGLNDPVLDAGGWRTYQRGLRTISRDSELVRARSSGHDIALDQPRLVIAAVRTVVGTARSHGTLPSCRRLYPPLGGDCEPAQ